MKLITDELRDLSKSCKYYYMQPIVLGQPLSAYFVDLANRIDKKHDEEIKSLQSTIRKLNDAIAEKQELNENSKSAQIEFCNVAKMKEALENCANMGEQIDCQLGSSDATVYAFRHERSLAHNISECARAALAEPDRECDVGTPEEQGARLRRFCLNQKWCDRCPLNKRSIETHVDCKLLWAQMTYKKEGVK